MLKPRKIAALFVVLMLLGAAGCKKENTFEIPENMGREEAALFTAIASVCPKNENHSKAEYLTFHIGGWSFDTLPPEILDYLEEYCRNGGARLIQLTYDELEAEGYIVNGDGNFYDESEATYMLGKGKLFTFVKNGDENSDRMTVKLDSFSSDSDSNGYDIELVFKRGKWKVEKFSNPRSRAYAEIPESAARNRHAVRTENKPADHASLFVCPS